MANAADLRGKTPFRGFLIGFPGSGKTGSIAALANAGYKIRMLDFDGNADSLLSYLDDRALENVDIITFTDRMVDKGKKGIMPKGIPTAFTGALQTMRDGWKSTDASGNEVDLGNPEDWGSDTIVVVDSLTKVGEASRNRVLHEANRTSRNSTRQTWGAAMDDQMRFLEIIADRSNGYHVLVTAHLKLFGPKAIEKDDDDTTQEIKRELIELVPHRYFPAMLGTARLPELGGQLPIIVLAEAKAVGHKTKRVLVTEPRPEVDVKVPAKDLPRELPIGTGMLDIFKALGHIPPGWDK